MSIANWSLLGFTVWTFLLVVVGIGVPRLTAIAQGARPNSFVPGTAHGSERYQRTMRAHMNCVENLPVFAVLVLTGTMLHLRGAFDLTAALVLAARVLQSATHIASGRNRAVILRFAFFVVQLVCFVAMTLMIARAAARGSVGRDLIEAREIGESREASDRGTRITCGDSGSARLGGTSAALYMLPSGRRDSCRAGCLWLPRGPARKRRAVRN